MTRRVAPWIVAAAAGLAVSTGIAAAEEAKRPAVPTPAALRIAAVRKPASFYTSFLAPRIDARLVVESSAAADFVSRTANPWTRDPAAVRRVEKGAIRATTGAFKRYAIDRLGIDGWSLPLVGGSGRGLAALRTDAGGTRLRFGFAHLAPRAEVLIPSAGGRFGVSLDARGGIGASYETKASGLRFGVSLDPFSHDATLGLIRRF